MKHALRKILLLPLALAIGVDEADLRMDFVPRFNGRPLAFDALTNQIASGQKISVTRVDFLLSDFMLRRADGVWVGQKDWFAYLGAREGKNSFTLENIPVGNYDRIRFHLGLEPSVNHGGYAAYSPQHPWNPHV